MEGKQRLTKPYLPLVSLSQHSAAASRRSGLHSPRVASIPSNPSNRRSTPPAIRDRGRHFPATPPSLPSS
ncbi:unnamed protein product [Linum trigynum]|uniref:Uncharacterized protein n=1 Tax=Linum trigynum TaxID=586398 RepID=A0AAV2DC47_9ROSI